MANYKKLFSELTKVHKIKYSQIRISKREDKDEEPYIPESSVGSVYGVQDSKIQFDGQRQEFKDALRPCVIIKKDRINETWIAPGTGKYHYGEECITAEVPPEQLEKTTYFLLYFRQRLLDKTLKRKICSLSFHLIKQIEEMTNEY